MLTKPALWQARGLARDGRTGAGVDRIGNNVAVRCEISTGDFFSKGS
jgi:hypothetical protein